MNKAIRFLAVAGAGAVITWSGAALAGGAQQDCTAAGYSTTYADCASNASKAGTQVVSAETLRAAATQTSGLISSRIASFTSSGPQARASRSGNQLGELSIGLTDEGIASGSEPAKIGLWINGGFTTVDYDKAGSEFGGEIYTGMFGADYKVTDKLVLGGVVAYENTDLDTSFNRGGVQADGWTVGGYGIYMIDKTYSVDFSGGYTFLTYDMERNDPLVGSSITGTTDADRYFVAANLNGLWAHDAFRFGAQAGTLWTSETKDAFTETGTGATSVAENTTDIGQVSLGGRVGYNIAEVVEPYLRAKYRYDYEDADADDADDMVLGAGVQLFVTENFSGNIEYSTTVLRDDFSSHTGTATLRVEF